jgi:hypothetical protein
MKQIMRILKSGTTAKGKRTMRTVKNPNLERNLPTAVKLASAKPV